MRPKPGAQQGPEAFDGVDVNLVKAVAVFIAGLLPSAVADGLVLVAPRPQAAVEVVLVGQHQCARRDARLDQRMNGDLADVFEPADDDLAAALHHAEDGGFLLLERAATPGALQAVSSALAVLFSDCRRMPLVTGDDLDLITLNRSVEDWGGLAIDDPFPELGRHALHVVLVQVEFSGDLRVRQVQPHEIETQDQVRKGR